MILSSKKKTVTNHKKKFLLLKVSIHAEAVKSKYFSSHMTKNIYRSFSFYSRDVENLNFTSFKNTLSCYFLPKTFVLFLCVCFQAFSGSYEERKTLNVQKQQQYIWYGMVCWQLISKLNFNVFHTTFDKFHSITREKRN